MDFKGSEVKQPQNKYFEMLFFNITINFGGTLYIDTFLQALYI